MKFDNGIIYKMFNIHIKLVMEIVKSSFLIFNRPPFLLKLTLLRCNKITKHSEQVT